MTISRRQFLHRSALAAATVAAPHPLLRGMVGTAHAAPSDAILVLVQLEGGNDGLNTVVPMNDAGPVAQRSLYETARPNLALSLADLAATEIDPDPVNGTRLALHPVMTGLKQLYDEGKVAVINGVGYPNQSLSHFRSEDIWFSADPVAAFSSGWFGRWLDATYTPADLVAVCVNETLNPLFISQESNVLAVRRLSDFALPDDPEYPDLAAKQATLQAAYAVEADPGAASGLQLAIGTSGNLLLGKLGDYAAVSTNWASNLNGIQGRLANSLKQVASIIRHDAANPPEPTGARFFHVRLGGFDTHTGQGALTGRQPDLLSRVSTAIRAFHDDMVALGVAQKVVLVTFSEFGRRVAENGSGSTSGTDHGEASPLFVVGDPVAGGVYGALPALNDLRNGNLKFHTDFRRVYATLIDRWLAAPGAHVPLLPGAPYTTMGFLA